MNFMDSKVMILLIIISIIIVIIVTTSIMDFRGSSKTVKVIVPDYKDTRENQFKKKERKKKGSKLKQSLVQKYHLEEKINAYYIRAGVYDKTLNDFLKDERLCVVLALLFFGLLYYFTSNVFIAIIISLVLLFIPILELKSKVSDREKQFIKDFPYFLKTLAFILENGANINLAFQDAVYNLEDGVLKEVMLSVLERQKATQDFAGSFSAILEKVKCNDTVEFVETVQSSIEKGVAVEKLFSFQSKNITNYLNAKQKKKVKNISNMILIPLLMSLCSVIILLL